MQCINNHERDRKVDIDETVEGRCVPQRKDRTEIGRRVVIAGHRPLIAAVNTATGNTTFHRRPTALHMDPVVPVVRNATIGRCVVGQPEIRRLLRRPSTNLTATKRCSHSTTRKQVVYTQTYSLTAVKCVFYSTAEVPLIYFRHR